MLIGLTIRDVVLVEALDLAFGPGLTVLTGETGAGKSIILDALGLACGARAEAGLVRAGAERATAAAVLRARRRPRRVDDPEREGTRLRTSVKDLRCAASSASMGEAAPSSTTRRSPSVCCANWANI